MDLLIILKVNELWKSVILNTQFYDELQSALGLRLHHQFGHDSNHIDQHHSEEDRLAVMKALYTVFFSRAPIESDEGCSSPSQHDSSTGDSQSPTADSQDLISFSVEMAQGTRFFRAKPTTKISSLRREVGNLLINVPRESITLTFGGRVLHDSQTISGVVISNGDCLQCHYRRTW